MATFRVGQRVRLVAAIGASPKEREQRSRLNAPIIPIGTEGTIRRPARGRRDWAIEFDGYTTGVKDMLFACFCSEIEPIQPERNRVVTWEECPIDPRKIGELA